MNKDRLAVATPPSIFTSNRPLAMAKASAEKANESTEVALGQLYAMIAIGESLEGLLSILERGK